ncbi:chemotaxis protein CheB [Spirosoma pomorum]
MLGEDKFYIAAVGVSAGGMDPLHTFFAQIPPDSGIAFVVISHLNRDFVSRADELLAQHTPMPVCWATEGQEVRPNSVYMIPVNKMMTIENGSLHLQTRRVEDKINWAVDIFFKSLAKAKQTYAIGIILSGAGTDGTLGAIAIHNEAGMVLVQDPQTAAFTSMPQSAIMRDHPRQVLSPKRLAQALLTLVAELT